MKNIRTTLTIVWRIAAPYFRSEDKWAGGGLLAAVVAIELSLVAIDVLVNQWNNRFYNALQQRRRFHGADAMLGKQVGQCVQLERQFAERIVWHCIAGPEGVVLLAQRTYDVGERLQRANDVLVQCQRQ